MGSTVIFGLLAAAYTLFFEPTKVCAAYTKVRLIDRHSENKTTKVGRLREEPKSDRTFNIPTGDRFLDHDSKLILVLL